MSPRNGFGAMLQRLPMPRVSLGQPHRQPRRRKRTPAERLERLKQEVISAQRSGPLFPETRELLERFTHILTS